MRRLLFAIVVLTVVLAAPGAASAAPGAVVRLTACEPALVPSGRLAAFEGRMSRAARGERLQMRFALEVRTPGNGGWRAVAAPGFSTWYTAARDVARWTYAKRVKDLLAPASYRTVLDARWRDRDGRIVRRSRATSTICRQRDLRPDLRHDLRAGALGVLPAPGAALRYEIPVRNAGRSAAGAAELTFETAGRVLTGAIPALAAGAETTVQVRGPACAPGTAVILTLDPTGQIDEADEADDRRVIPCPSAAHGAGAMRPQ